MRAFIALLLASNICLASSIQTVPFERGGTGHNSAYGNKVIPFSDGAQFTDNGSAFVWDNANTTLNLGTSTTFIPGGLDILVSRNGISGPYVINTNTGTAAQAGILATNGGGGGTHFSYFTQTGANFTSFPDMTTLGNLAGNGVAIGAPTSKAIGMYQNSVLKASVTTGGDFQSETTLIARSALKLEDPGAGTNAITIQAPTLSAPYSLTLPVDDGTAGQALTTDGSGVLSWATASATPGGATTAVQFNTAGAFDGDAATFSWDNTGKTLILGTGATAVPFGIGLNRTDVDGVAGSAGGEYARHNSQTTVNGGQLYVGVQGEEWTQVDAGIANGVGAVGVIGNVYRNVGVADAGTLGVMAAVFAGTNIVSTDAAAVTSLATVYYGQVQYNSGNITDAYDIYFQPGSIGGSTITNRYGIFLPPDNTGVKKNFISGLMAIGQTYSTPLAQLDVTGDIRAINTLANDTGGSAANMQVSSHVTTGTVSATTIGEDLSATGIVDAGAENDKNVSGQTLTVTRGNNTDDGILDGLAGSTVLMFNNSGNAGVTQNAVGYDSLFFAQQGLTTNLYQYRAQFIPAGSGTATNYYGYYVGTGSSGAVTNGWAFYNADSTLKSSFAGEVNFLTDFTLTGNGNLVTVQASASTTAPYSLTLPVDDGTAGQALTTDGSGVTSWSDLPTSGTYAPTFTNTVNLASDPVINNGTCKYIRVGSIVDVACYLNIDATLAATQTQFTMSLPFTTTNNEAAGTCTGGASFSVNGECLTEQNNADDVQVTWTAGTTAARDMGLKFSYIIQ